MKNFRVWGLAVLLLAWAGLASAQQRSYSEGPVLVVTSVKVMDGQFENYMHYLDTTYKALMESSKEAGMILDYSVFSASPRGPDDADLYLVVTYPNMAMLDGLDDKMEPVMAKVTKMNLAQRDEASGKRTVMRTILGSEMIRELKLK
ncbi:MAG: hypothetical protein ABIO58_00295 [Luteimonas sp.]